MSVTTILGKVTPTPRGAWNATVQYEAIDIVSYNGGGWISKRPNIGVQPVDGDDWLQLSERGSDADVTAENIAAALGYTPTSPTYVSESVDVEATERSTADEALRTRISTIEGKESGWDAKQDAITDLTSIRSGAALGATALQSVPSTYRTAAAQDTIDAGKVDKVTGKGLSTNDYTNAEKSKLEGIEDGAEANVQPDWNQTDTGADDFIKNKPTIPEADTEAVHYTEDSGRTAAEKAQARANIGAASNTSLLDVQAFAYSKVAGSAFNDGYINDYNSKNIWTFGVRISPNNGNVYTDINYIMSDFIPESVAYIKSSVGKYQLFAYNKSDGSYVGCFKYVTTYDWQKGNTYISGPLDMNFLRNVFPDYNIRVQADLTSIGDYTAIKLYTGKMPLLPEYKDVYEYAPIGSYTYRRNNEKLNGKGWIIEDTNYYVVQYYVAGIDTLYLNLTKDNDCVFMFSTNNAISAQNACVDVPYYETVNGYVKVPSGANYLCVSQLKTNTSNIVGIATIGKNVRGFENEEDLLYEKIIKNRDANTLVFGVTTDNHFGGASKGYGQLYYTKEYAKLTDMVNADFQANLGDMIDENTSDPEINAKRISYMIKELTNTQAPFLYTIGHHEGYPQTSIVDGEQEYSLPKRRIIGLTQNNMKWCTSIHATANSASASYYVDFARQKIRYIVLDSASYHANGFSEKVRDFLSNDALHNVPQGYKVIVTSHSPTRANAIGGTAVSYGSEVETILADFISGGGNVLAYIHGHTHYDNVIPQSLSGLNYPLISVCCAAVEKSSPSEQTIGNPTSYDRANYNYTAFCMDVFCVHADTGTIDMFRFGAGHDRHINSAVTLSDTITLTSVLTGSLTWESSNAAIATVNNGVVTRVTTGECYITATDTDGNKEWWPIK